MSTIVLESLIRNNFVNKRFINYAYSVDRNLQARGFILSKVSPGKPFGDNNTRLVNRIYGLKLKIEIRIFNENILLQKKIHRKSKHMITKKNLINRIIVRYLPKIPLGSFVQVSLRRRFTVSKPF